MKLHYKLNDYDKIIKDDGNESQEVKNMCKLLEPKSYFVYRNRRNSHGRYACIWFNYLKGYNWSVDILTNHKEIHNIKHLTSRKINKYVFQAVMYPQEFIKL